MRVLHVVATNQRRGAEVFAADLAAALAELGVEQEVAVLRDGPRPSVAFPVPAVDLGAHGVAVPGIRIAPRALRGLRRACARFGPDVVQLHGGEPLKYAVAARLHARAPVVYRRIGDLQQLRGWVPRRPAYAWLSRRAARVVAVCEALRRELVERFGVAPERAVTIPNAVDPRRLDGRPSREEARDRLGLHRGAKVILSLGALTWEKDPLGHLAATEPVLERDPGAVHALIGDGPLHDPVLRAVQGSRFGDRIRLLPTQADVRMHLAAADVLLLASRTEGMPASVIEAGMLGLPVVAYAVAGVPEVVVDGETGLLAPPGDRAGLAARLLTLLQDGDLRGRMGAAARERCRALFDIRGVAPRYLELYEGLAG